MTHRGFPGTDEPASRQFSEVQPVQGLKPRERGKGMVQNLHLKKEEINGLQNTIPKDVQDLLP